MTWSHAVVPESSGRWFHAAISSAHVQCDWGPRNWEAFSAVNVNAVDPFGHFRSRSDGMYSGTKSTGEIWMMPEFAADHDVTDVGHGPGDQVTDGSWLFSGFLDCPGCSGAGLACATTGQLADHFGVVLVGGQLVRDATRVRGLSFRRSKDRPGTCGGRLPGNTQPVP